MELTARRITVVGPHRRIDLALPAQSPIAELVPQLVRMAGIEAYPAGPAGWVLNRLGSPPLEGAATVAAAGICDGEVLYLNPAATAPAPMLFDDVVDAIARAVEERPGVWRPEVSRRVGAAVSGLVFAGIAVLIGVAGSGLPAAAKGAGPVLAGALAVLLLVTGGAVARSYGDSMVAAALVAGGLPAAMVAGSQSGSQSFGGAGMPWSTAASLGVGFAAVALYAVLAAIVIADRAAWFVPAAVAAAIGGVAAAVTVDLAVRPAVVAALVTVTVIALSPVLPSVALRLGRLPLPRVPSDVAAFRRDEKPTLGPEVGRGTRAAEDALTALLAALAVTVAGATVVVLRSGATGATAACGLAGAAGLVLLLRARAYLGTGQRAALLLGGAAALVGTGVRLASIGDARVWLGLIGTSALIGVVCAISAVRAPGRSPSPYWSRLLDVAEFLALISLVPTAAAVMGVYSAIRAWAG
jgi:type VII secretion integral membrane protein EccD